MAHEMYKSVYDAGFAVGEGRKEDTMCFRFRDEVFELPSEVVHPFVKYNGYFYEIPIDKLRELEREAAEKS